MSRAIALTFFLLAGSVHAAEYPNMEGAWMGIVRTVSSGEEVRSQVARGGAVIQEVELTFTVTYQDGEVFTGETRSTAANSVPLSVWGAIRSTGREAVFVTSNGGRGQLWFSSPTEFEYCYANLTQEQMSAYCAVLAKQP